MKRTIEKNQALKEMITLRSYCYGYALVKP